MKQIPFILFFLLPVGFLVAELSPDQVKNLREQQEAYGEIPEREIEYYEKTAPRDPDKNRSFYLQDHPLQEKPIPRDTVK